MVSKVVEKRTKKMKKKHLMLNYFEDYFKQSIYPYVSVLCSTILIVKDLYV